MTGFYMMGTLPVKRLRDEIYWLPIFKVLGKEKQFFKVLSSSKQVMAVDNWQEYDDDLKSKFSKILLLKRTTANGCFFLTIYIKAKTKLSDSTHGRFSPFKLSGFCYHKLA